LENANAFMSSSVFRAGGPATDPRWQTTLLEQPGRSDHIAVVYQDEDFLVKSAGRFIASGLRSGDGIVVLCTLPHWEMIRERLAGVDLVSATRRGQLVRSGVHNILLGWMSANCDQAEFDEAVGGLVDAQLGQYAAVRVFSELADLLLEKDNRLIATNAQRAWNSYLRGKQASVLSPWRLGSLYSEGYSTRIARLYFMHSHILTDDNGALPGLMAQPGSGNALAR